MINSECGAYRCRGCGRVIGSCEDHHVVIRHKGRTIRIKPISGASEIQIVCEKPSCHATSTFIIQEPQNVESLDKSMVHHT